MVLDRDMRTKLTDYGRDGATMRVLVQAACKESADDQQEPSAYYYAPEILRLEPLRASADVWSFGCLITRLASMRELFSIESAANGLSTHAVIEQIASGTLMPTADAVEARAQAEALKRAADAHSTSPSSAVPSSRGSDQQPVVLPKPFIKLSTFCLDQVAAKR